MKSKKVEELTYTMVPKKITKTLYICDYCDYDGYDKTDVLEHEQLKHLCEHKECKYEFYEDDHYDEYGDYMESSGYIFFIELCKKCNKELSQVKIKNDDKLLTKIFEMVKENKT